MSTEFIINILVGLLCGALGFGVSQLVIVAEVKKSSLRISQAEKHIEILQAQMDRERDRVDDRIRMLVEVVNKVLDQGKELLMALRLQNNLRPKGDT